MTKISFATHPNLLGFDRLDHLVELSMKSSNDGYPPYNIEVISQNRYRITLAVAGFQDDELDITLDTNQLTIKGAQSETQKERVFLHRGIATRQFQRSFVLADGVKVGDAIMANGLLHIDLMQEIPATVSKTIPINQK